jgi:hypothetical protein
MKITCAALLFVPYHVKYDSNILRMMFSVLSVLCFARRVSKLLS